MRVLIVILSVLAIAVMMTRLPVFPHGLRGVDLKIKDRKTEHPIGGVLVYRSVQAAGPGNLLGIPWLDPILYRYVRLQQFISDTGGTVTIESGVVFLKLYEKLLAESIYINMDTPNTDSTEVGGERVKRFVDFLFVGDSFHPNQNYSGFLISSWIDDDNDVPKSEHQPGYDVLILHGRNLESQEDLNIIVELDSADHGD